MEAVLAVRGADDEEGFRETRETPGAEMATYKKSTESVPPSDGKTDCKDGNQESSAGAFLRPSALPLLLSGVQRRRREREKEEEPGDQHCVLSSRSENKLDRSTSDEVPDTQLTTTTSVAGQAGEDEEHGGAGKSVCGEKRDSGVGQEAAGLSGDAKRRRKDAPVKGEYRHPLLTWQCLFDHQSSSSLHLSDLRKEGELVYEFGGGRGLSTCSSTDDEDVGTVSTVPADRLCSPKKVENAFVVEVVRDGSVVSKHSLFRRIENNAAQKNQEPEENNATEKRNAPEEVRGKHETITQLATGSCQSNSASYYQSWVVVGSSAKDVEILYENPYVSRRHLAFQLLPVAAVNGLAAEEQESGGGENGKSLAATKHVEKKTKETGDSASDPLSSSSLLSASAPATTNCGSRASSGLSSATSCANTVSGTSPRAGSLSLAAATRSEPMYVSRRKSEVNVGMFAIDLGSSYGTFLNRSTERLPPHVYIRLQDGDVLHTGPRGHVKRMLVVTILSSPSEEEKKCFVVPPTVFQTAEQQLSVGGGRQSSAATAPPAGKDEASLSFLDQLKRAKEQLLTARRRREEAPQTAVAKPKTLDNNNPFLDEEDAVDSDDETGCEDGGDGEGCVSRNRFQLMDSEMYDTNLLYDEDDDFFDRSGDAETSTKKKKDARQNAVSRGSGVERKKKEVETESTLRAKLEKLEQDKKRLLTDRKLLEEAMKRKEAAAARCKPDGQGESSSKLFNLTEVPIATGPLLETPAGPTNKVAIQTASMTTLKDAFLLDEEDTKTALLPLLPGSFGEDGGERCRPDVASVCPNDVEPSSSSPAESHQSSTSEAAPVADVDSLDAFMNINSASLKGDSLAKVDRRLANLQSEIDQNKALLDIILK